MTKTKEELLRRLDQERQCLLQALETLSDEELCVSNAVGEWSIKDLLGHIADWERILTEEIVRIRDERPPVEPWRENGIDGLNAKLSAMKKHLSLEQIREEFFRVRQELIPTIEGLPSELLDKNVLVQGRKRNIQWYVREAWRHDQEHLPDIITWQRQLETTEI